MAERGGSSFSNSSLSGSSSRIDSVQVEGLVRIDKKIVSMDLSQTNHLDMKGKFINF